MADVCVNEPDVPVIVTVDGPVAAVLLALSVNTLVVAVLAGLNDAVMPAGRPEAARVTLPVNPPVGVIVIVLVLPPPCATLRAVGTGANVKPVVTGPANVAASMTTSRFAGNVKL
jgi:hypothetical protein